MSESLQTTLERLRWAQAQDPTPDWGVRKDRLQRLENLLLMHAPSIREAIDADFGGRCAQETDLLELYPGLTEIRHALRRGKRWMRGSGHWAGFPFFPARNRLLPQPLGVVGIIVPWNYPLNLAVCPLAGALAAGNRVMLKMSEHTPRFSAQFASLIQNHFASDEIVVVNGDAGVADAFSRLAFDHLLFTGSTRVGHHVMAAAAAQLTPVTLELGGKSPVLVGPGARLEQAVERIMIGKLVNAGQTCVAPDYVLLPRLMIPRFIELAQACVTRLYPQLSSNPQYTSIISERHCQRLIQLREDARERGAIVVALGLGHEPPASHKDGPFNGRRLAPTLLLDPPPSAAVMQEEIFGPLLPLVGYEHFDEAIDFVRARPHPLAMYLFDTDQGRVDMALRQTQAGGVSVNDTLYHVAQHGLPFGGVGPSGMGGYHGEHGFRTFSHLKPVFSQARYNGAGLLAPPYGALFARMMRFFLGRD